MAGRVAPFIDNTGLVFAYDLANVQRSYLGEPTTNLATNTPSLGGWPGSYTVIDSDTKTFDFTTSTVEWGGDASWTTFYYNVSAYTGQYVTISATFEYASDPNKFNFLWIGQTSGSETYLGYSSEADRNQKSTDDREDISWSGVIGSGGKVGILIWMSNGNSTTVTARISNIQVEVKSHKTPFATGTRSVTQGLKDLTGRSTIDLTNVSFDANAQMTFDGTNDYVEMSSFNIDQNNEFTLEAIIYPNTVSGNQSIIKKNTSNDNWPIFSMTLIGSNINGYYSSPTYGQCLEGADGTSGIITANKFWHVAYSKGAGGYTTMKLYINGVSVPYSNFLYGSHINSIATSTKPIHIGRNLDGASWIQPFNGIIPVSRVYNRQLTDSEIQQNFNAIKGRYGL